MEYKVLEPFVDSVSGNRYEAGDMFDGVPREYLLSCGLVETVETDQPKKKAK